MPKRIAVWSGPRNVSTALMRAFGSRADTAVADEPLYAHYLAQTGAPHPGREEVVRVHETDPARVIAWITGPIPDGKELWYQKHMAHHLLPSIDGDWLDRLDHALLIRDPREMLVSLAKVIPSPTLADTGLPQQIDLAERATWLRGRAPPVVDASDLLRDPRRTLGLLCAALGVPFDAAMLSWAPGPRATDGVWAKHWYAAVEASTGFEPWRERRDELPPRLDALHRECVPLYRRLHALRLGG